MKFKLSIGAILASICLFPPLALAYHDPDESIWAYCERSKIFFDKRERHISVFGYYKWVLNNKTPNPVDYTATMRICFLDTGKCSEKVKKVHQNPWGHFASAVNRTEVEEYFREPGRHLFKVTLDITGDRNEHTEKTCELVNQ